MESMHNELNNIIQAFGIKGDLVDIKQNTDGHINSTFVSVFDNDGKIEKYTHQRINKDVFPSPEKVMDNIVKVTDYISKQIDSKDKERLVLKVINALDKRPYYVDQKGEYWRCYRYIDNAVAFSKCTSLMLAKNLAIAIGDFHLKLSGFDGSLLFPSIKDFHNMVMRYDALSKAVEQDRMARAKGVRYELGFLFDNMQRGEKIWKDYENGLLPNRVTHNDTKINNVLFDKDSMKHLAVIDLDTIMPGTILFDIWDMIRTSCNSADEDERNLGKVEFNVSIYEALIYGYLSKTGRFLKEPELSGILESGRMMTQIMAVRFLTDYLDGDRYYRISYPEHNLIRARNQIKLISSMDKIWSKLDEMTTKVIQSR